MTANVTGPVPHVPITPVDPESESGRRIAEGLGRVFTDIDERVAREATATKRKSKKPA